MLSSLEAFLLITHATFSVISGFKLTIIHTNDVHARFEQFNKYGSECRDSDAKDGKCFGGVARRYTKIEEIRGSHDNVLLLDAGDQFSGSIFFSVYRGKATQNFMTKLKYDLMCLGNHEFDLGVEPLAWFLGNVTFPVVSCNTDVTMETRLQGKFSKSVRTTVGGETIGVIGFTTEDTAEISVPGPTVFFGSIIECVKAEVKVLQDQGVNKIIALGHAGFAVDQQVAAIDGVDIVVGGHTNTFLYNGAKPSNEEPAGTYPVIVNQPGGGRGLVVQDFMWGKYLGYLNVTFDNNGIVTEHSGNPILLDNSVVEDVGVKAEVELWKGPIRKQMSQVIGYSKVTLTGGSECRLKECNLGNLITDAMISYHLNYSHPGDHWAPAAIALCNGGGIRTSIDKGPVTLGEIKTALPFDNEIDLITVKGSNLRDQLEHSVLAVDPKQPNGRFLQMSGLRVVYNIDMPVGQRVMAVEVRCLECDVPSYFPLKDDSEYKIFLPVFLINGGDGYKFEPIKHEPFNTLDSLIMASYMTSRSLVFAEEQGRIRYVSEKQTSASSRNFVPSFSTFLFVILLLFV